MKLMTANFAPICTLLALGTVSVFAQQPPSPATATAAAPAVTSPAATTTAAPTTGGAKIQFQTPVYDFGKVKSGEPVKYTFIFTNTGTDTLYITNVQPSCGCTTAGEWSRKVEAGQTGTIPVQFNSANYGGQVLKTITVTSNDKGQPSIGLQLKGTVWKPVDVNPSFAVMTIPPDAQSNVTSKVHIVNNMEEPLTLSAPESNNQGFSAELKTNTPGKDFEMTISAKPPFDQPNKQAQITLKTSSTNMPTLSVTAWANIQQAIVVSPPQLMLAAGPLPNKQTLSVNIQNNSANPMKVSEPAIDIKDAEVKLTEPNPGRSFVATIIFPQGLDLPQGTKAELTLKTDHPRHPLIKVPVTQFPKPVAVPASAPHPVPSPLLPAPGTPAPTPPAAAPKTASQ